MGNSYTTEFRQYEPRVGRWLTLDPIFKPHESLYSAFANNPVWFRDPNGADTTLDVKSRLIIKDLINPKSKDYNEEFSKDFQKLVDDNSTVYNFIQWDKRLVESVKDGKKKTAYGYCSGAGINEAGQNLINIEYTLDVTNDGHQLEALFEEFDHSLQYMSQRIGYLNPVGNERGNSFAYGFDDEVDNKLSRVKYIQGFKEGSIYKTQLFGLNAKIVKSNFERKVAEKNVLIHYNLDKDVLNVWQVLSKNSDYSETELFNAFNEGVRWNEFLIGPGK